MNIRNIPTWLGLLAALYLVTACDRVYDDLSGCLGNTIVFSYLADDNQEHLQEYVDDIDVFIFDVGNGALVEKHHLEGEQLLSPLEKRSQPVSPFPGSVPEKHPSTFRFTREEKTTVSCLISIPCASRTGTR